MLTEIELPHTIGRYTLTRRLGRGGMGVVFAARDERLGREVAVKMIAGLSSEDAIRRFWREARAAASVSHPNVCQIYEVDETGGGIYLAMELLEGEALDARLQRGPCTPKDAVNIAVDVLSALAALHERGLVHRDVKPSNTFLTPHGVKLLDFGLARTVGDDTLQLDGAAADQITRPGMVVGTPRYMSPEQFTTGALDARTDLYSVGVMLFEMLAGRPPFTGASMFDIAHAVMNEHPPALQGPPAVVAIDRVIRRALEKDPAARYPTAIAMADELRVVPLSGTEMQAVASVRALMRLVVPPLRQPREDPDTAFLSYGLAEAVSGSLAALPDVVVRSPALASKWEDASTDPRRLAADADVDLIVGGSLARMGDQLRATLQLIDAGTGTVVGATSVRGLMSEIFAFEDELTKSVITLLAPRRQVSGSAPLRRDVPANGRAFEHFLRGLELARKLGQQRQAREWFERALAEDPAFAPAWAWIGRSHRVIGKFEEDYEGNERRAEEAFRRALALSPDLPVAHRFFTHFESEHGRADAAIARLLQHAKANRNDAQLFAALVHACRYAGLLGASMASHEEARRLDPTVPTSVEYTLLMLGDAERLRSTFRTDSTEGAHMYLLVFANRLEELREVVKRTDIKSLPPSLRGMFEGSMSGDPTAALALLHDAMRSGTQHDPEAVFLAGMMACHLGEHETGLSEIQQGVRDGFAAVHTLEHSPALETVRHLSEFGTILDDARQRRRIALAVFERGDGPTLLGINAADA